jgi:peptidyl-prolyl cis-trans isomerase SurA
MKFARLASLLLSFVLLLPALTQAQTRELSSSGQLLDRIAAIVNDGVVLTSELDEQTEEVIARLRQQNTELPPRNVLRRQILERLIMEEIQMQRAQRLGIQVSDEMLNGALADVAQRNGISFADLPRQLEAQGIDYRSYREEIRKQLTLQLLRQRDVIGRINISPRELEQALARQQSGPDLNSEYNVSHILISVPVSATPEQIQAREERAREVWEKARAGQDFAQLAVTYSESSTNIEGGSLGWRKGSQLPSIIADVIPKLKPGEVSDPIRTPSGFHLFRLNEVRGGIQQAVQSQVHARHILLRTNELEDDETVRQKLADIRRRVLEGGEDFGAIAAVTSQDPGSGPARARSSLSSSNSSTACRRTRSASRSRRSSVGTSCSCSAAAYTTSRKTSCVSRSSFNCANRRPKKKPSFGCAGCATKPSSNTGCESGLATILREPLPCPCPASS